MKSMDLLVTLDGNYIKGLYVMLKSIFVHNSQAQLRIHMFYNGISDQHLQLLAKFCEYHDAILHPVEIEDNTFADAPVSRYLSKAMYYRLLACDLLPENLNRVLYLDTDILVINPMYGLYETNLEGYMFGACMHTGFASIAAPMNKIRLKSYKADGYFNTGMLLMNLSAQRGKVSAHRVFEYIEKKGNGLILQDQDVFNALYGDFTKRLDDSLYNFDVNYYDIYRIVSNGTKNISWMLRNTVILHYCGKVKPWDKPSRNRFDTLYSHYSVMTDRVLDELSITMGINCTK